MFDRFSQPSRRLMGLARQECHRLDHDWIDTGHILLGMLATTDGRAAQALADLAVTADRVRERLMPLWPRRRRPTTPDAQIPFTKDAKHLLERALEHAQQLGHDWIDDGHLLLALLDDDRSPGGAALAACGAGPGQRTWLHERLRTHWRARPAPPKGWPPAARTGAPPPRSARWAPVLWLSVGAALGWLASKLLSWP